MKLKMKILLMLIIALMVLPIIGTSISNAADTTKVFAIKGLRTVHDYSSSSNYFSGPFTYRSTQSDTKIAIPYHIGEKTSSGYVWNQAIYCLNEGHGFRDDADSTLIVERTYDAQFDMKKPSEIPQEYKNPWGTDTAKYNSILWIIDNMYVPEHEDEQEKQAMKERLLQTAFAEKLSTGEISSIEDIYLTDDDIEAVQQMAIWHFTNQTLYNAIWISPQEVVVNNSLQLEGFNPMWELDEELVGGEDENPYITEEGRYRDEDMATLYNYLVAEAAKNSSYKGEMEITFQDKNPTAVKSQVGTNYIIGPFNIEKTGGDASYTFVATLVDQDNKPITNYAVVNQNGSSITGIRTIEDAIGKGDFYISIPRTVFTNSDSKNITINMSAQYSRTKATLWTNYKTFEQEQPVVVVEKTEQPVEYGETIELQDDYFDLALRKYIVAVNGVHVTDREPGIVTSGLVAGTDTTATYKHRKDPVRVDTGSIVTYKIAIFNEGNVDGRATEIIDQLPEGVEFLEGVTLGYTYEAIEGNKVKITKTGTENLPAYTGSGVPSSEIIEIKCLVTAAKTEQQQTLTNVAWISKAVNVLGIVDRDSSPEQYPDVDNSDLPDYNGNTENKSDLTDSEYHYEGQQDDDDFEKLILPADEKIFDLALQKFITKVQDRDIFDREPVFNMNTNGQMSYESVDTPLLVSYGDLVEYTIRVYNEGDIAGYAELIQDDIPDGLEFVVDNQTNIDYRWRLSQDGTSVTSDYLSRQRDENNLINAFDQDSMKEPDYKDVKIVFKVVEDPDSLRIIVNTAEIAQDCDENGNDVEDEDSTPNNWTEGEDDLDKEYIRLQYFDLALQKFITKVNDIEIVNREPIFELDAEGKPSYKTNKTPVEVENQDIIIYTIRVYNEGNIAGYAQEITDDVPEWLEFLPEHEINTEYQWQLTQDGTQVSTTYLSKESNEQNILNYFNKQSMTTPDYKDVQIAFKVKEPETTDRIIINTAEITDDYNEYDIPDIDSTPDNWDEEEDDLDKEYVKVKYFDLSLLKYITTVTVIEDGNTVTTETGFTGPDEELIKIEINKNKINKTTVKITYTIKVTNEGEIGGYATEITDYIPEGLEFVQEDNPNWTMNENGTVSTNMLRDTYLNPGDSATVEITLRWKQDANNLGEKDNEAEITQDYNDSGTPDRDSTPGNDVPEEDDQDNAPILFSVKTGTAPTYFVLTLSTLTLVTAGVVLIKKYIM